jgi:hypothetical protein
MDDPKTRERDERTDDELKLPEDRVEDLEPGEDEAADVKGGIINAWPKKYDGG